MSCRLVEYLVADARWTSVEDAAHGSCGMFRWTRGRSPPAEEGAKSLARLTDGESHLPGDQGKGRNSVTFHIVLCTRILDRLEHTATGCGGCAWKLIRINGTAAHKRCQ